MMKRVLGEHQKTLLSSLLLTSLIASLLFVAPISADAGINKQLNFQGRLLNAQGAVVPDGYYNIEFKIYEGGDGQSAGDATGSPAGTLDWTEDYLNNNSQGVEVKDGFLSVQLGSINPFANQVNWNSDTLWLSMNIAGTGTTCSTFSACTPDGEMLPMKRMSSTPYAINSAMLGGLTSSDFVQLAQGSVQTDASNNDSVAINKTGTGDFVNLQSNGADAFTINNSGDVQFGSNADHTLSVAVATAGAGNSLTISAGSAAAASADAGGNLVLQGGAGDGTAASGSVIVKANTTDSTTAFQVQTAAGTPQFTADTTNNLVQIGSATANATPTLLVLNNYNSATDPATGYNGAMYYNTTMNLFRCYNNGGWVNCAKAGGVGGSGSANKVAFFNNDGNLQTNSQFQWDDTAGTLTVGVPAPTTYSVGDTGPAGGTIFYDKGNNNGGWQYLEVGPVDLSGTWGCSGTTVPTGSNLGDGPQNTANMIAAGCQSSSDAGQMSADYSLNGYTDWFLPSKTGAYDLYYAEYTHAVSLGLRADYYWTSTQGSTSANADWQVMSNGVQGESTKTTTHWFRPIREVSGSSATGLYVDTATSRVGIGTITPAHKLDVQGDTGITGNVYLDGTTTVKTSSTSAFSVQDTASNSVLSTNTINSIVQVGSATANTNQTLLVLNNYSSATDPTNGTNGAMYYNTSSNTFRCYKNGAWNDCSGAQGNFVNLQSSTPGTADTGNFNISGSGIAATLQGSTSILTPLLDSATASTALSIGTTNASEIDLNQDTVIAAGKNLTFATGAGSLDQSNSTGTFKTGSGDVSLNGNTAIASGKTFTANGTALFKNASDSATALQVQNTAGTPQFTVDNASSLVQIGSATANSNPTLLVLNNYNSASDPATGYNGAMYYNTTSNLFRCYQNGTWVDCAQAGGGAGAGTYVNLQSGTPGTAQTGDLNITGTGIAGILQGSTSVLTPLLDSATASTALAIGTTNASEIDLNQDTVIGSGKSLTIQGNLIAKAGANNLFSTDATNSVVQVGSATANTNQSLLILNNYSSATDPTNGTNGAMYYNTSTDLFRCYQNGSWVDCAMAGGGASGDFVQLAPGSAQLDSSTNSSIFINKTGASGNLLQLQASGSDAFVISHPGDISFGNNADHTISVSNAASGAGNNLTVSAGNAAASSNTNGGNLTLQGGAGDGSGAKGLVILGTPTFSTTTNDANCYTSGALVASSCTVSTASVDGSAAILVGFSVEGQTATLPAPTNTTAGRVIYIIAANNSEDFTLSVNGGGTGNEIAMRENTSATMIWSGSEWTAAGASSSTTLQAAYDNTLQSAGGAELVVSHTSNTNGLTIRDSTNNPVNGPLLSVQTNSAATLFSINSNVTEYSSDSGAEESGASAATFPANTWASIGSASVSRYTTVGDYIATGQGSVQVTTTALANDGVKNSLNTTLTANQHYNVSFAGRLTSGSFGDMYIYYSADGSTQSVACTTTAVIISSTWTKVNCSFTAPASGITSSNAILIGQTGATARTFYIDNLSVSIAADFNYATDGGVDDQPNFATNWPSAGGATVSYSNSVGNDAGDSAEVVTTGANQGITNNLSVAPLASSLYRVTVYSASTATGFDNFTVQYSPNGGTNMIGCVDYNTQTVSDTTSSFTKITCYIHTDGTAVTSPQVYFTQTDATARTFYVDTFSMTLATDKTPNVKIGGGQEGGPTTLFTLDSSASAPIASNNEQLLGSMYYDTSLGKIQCYEATGWGSCGSASNTIVTISPEYTNAVMHGTGVGTMTSDLCSGTLHINDGTSGQPTICASDETYNFYKWTSPQASAQTYSIYVTYQLPSTFNNFLPAQTSLMGRTDSTNSSVKYTVYNDTASGLSQCGGTITVSSGSVSSWQVGKADGAADPSTCGFAPGNSIVFKIDVTASQDANAYVGNLNFTFTNK